LNGQSGERFSSETCGALETHTGGVRVAPTTMSALGGALDDGGRLSSLCLSGGSSVDVLHDESMCGEGVRTVV
jgi:hypothetical protein